MDIKNTAISGNIKKKDGFSKKPGQALFAILPCHRQCVWAHIKFHCKNTRNLYLYRRIIL